MRNATIGLLALAFTLAIAGPAPAQDPAPAAQNQNTETKNLRKEIVRLKYVRADQIGVILNSYTSREGHVQYQNNLPFVLSVIDTPENVEKILAAIREIDVKPSDVLYTVQLVLGSEADATTDAELKNDPIVKELGKLLRYNGYTLLDATLVRGMFRAHSRLRVLGARPNTRGNHPERLALGEAEAQGRSFFRTQMCIAGLGHSNTLAHSGQQCCTWSWNSRAY